jgi:hypothetical protein
MILKMMKDRWSMKFFLKVLSQSTFIPTQKTLICTNAKDSGVRKPLYHYCWLQYRLLERLTH